MHCKLTTRELRQRKATIIAWVKEAVVEKQELADGFRYRFPGSDKTLALLYDFIKAERVCCNFFTFRISAGNPSCPVWLELSGPDGTKEFIISEIGL